MAYDNDRQIVLFVNTRRKTDKDPHWTGNLEIGGTQYWVSVWEREAKKTGNRYLGGVVNIKDRDEQAIPRDTRHPADVQADKNYHAAGGRPPPPTSYTGPSGQDEWVQCQRCGGRGCDACGRRGVVLVQYREPQEPFRDGTYPEEERVRGRVRD